MPRRVRLLSLVASALLAGCAGSGAFGTGSEGGSLPTMTLSSPAFVADGSIPMRFTCDGVDDSPALAWSGAPSGTAAYAYAFGGLALIMIIPLVQAWRLDPASGSELAVRR